MLRIIPAMLLLSACVVSRGPVFRIDPDIPGRCGYLSLQLVNGLREIKNFPDTSLLISNAGPLRITPEQNAALRDLLEVEMPLCEAEKAAIQETDNLIRERLLRDPESVGKLADLTTERDRKLKIYRRNVSVRYRKALMILNPDQRLDAVFLEASLDNPESG